MRRLVLALSAAATTGCAQTSVGLWADSDRGERSMAAIASIELPPDPASVRAPRPAVNSGKTSPSNDDEWEAPASKKAPAAVEARIPAAQNMKPGPAKTNPATAEAAAPDVTESWGPTVKVSKTAEFGSEPSTYRWLQGRASFVKISGQRVWKIRFAPYDQVDRFGGSFVLDGSIPPDLKEGDLVRVEGGPAAGETDTRNARYNCTRVTILQRSGRSEP